MSLTQRTDRLGSEEPVPKNVTKNFRDVSDAGPVEGTPPVWPDAKRLQQSIESAIDLDQLRPK